MVDSHRLVIEKAGTFANDSFTLIDGHSFRTVYFS